MGVIVALRTRTMGWTEERRYDTSCNDEAALTVSRGMVPEALGSSLLCAHVFVRQLNNQWRTRVGASPKSATSEYFPALADLYSVDHA